MKVKNLSISRTESYQTPANALVGVVNMTGEDGEIKLPLSAALISTIMDLVKTEMGRKAVRLSDRVEETLEEAAHEHKLLEADIPF